MSDEIAEFLRRAAARRAQQAAQQQTGQQPPPQQQPAPRPIQPIARPPMSAPLRPAEDVVVAAEIVPEQPTGSRVSQSVARHMNTQAFDRRAEKMGDATEQADERMAAHLHEAFDRKLGSISDPMQATTVGVTAEHDHDAKVVIAVHPVIAMLTNPQTVRNAIIMNEILKRPDENW